MIIGFASKITKKFDHVRDDLNKIKTILAENTETKHKEYINTDDILSNFKLSATKSPITYTKEKTFEDNERYKIAEEFRIDISMLTSAVTEMNERGRFRRVTAQNKRIGRTWTEVERVDRSRHDTD